MDLNRAHPGYRGSFARHIEQRMEVVPHFKDRSQALVLDEHQQEAMLEMGVALQDETHRRAFSIVHCCGAGKTVLEANLMGASQDAKQDLGIADERLDITLVTERALKTVVRDQYSALGLDDIGIWGAGEKKLDRPMLLATVQALQRNRKALKKLLPLDKVDLLIGDEADYYLTEQRSNVVEQLGGTLRVGFTATPRWRDGRDISELWGPKIHSVPLKEGIRRGINTPPVWFLYESEIDQDSIRIRAGDYEPKTLEAALKYAEIHKAIPDIYRAAIEKNRRNEFPTLVYVPSTPMVELVTSTMREQFANEGLRIERWTGDETSSAQLEEDVLAFKNGEIHILVLCEMGGRGLDVPAARFLIDAYPTLSPTKLEQRHGRVLRRVREGSPLHQRGFTKPYSMIAQIVPKANRFRPLCLPDILDGWDDAAEGRPLGGSSIDGGAPWLEEVMELLQRIENKRPSIAVSLVNNLNLYQSITTPSQLPQADAKGFIYLPPNYGEEPRT